MLSAGFKQALGFSKMPSAQADKASPANLEKINKVLTDNIVRASVTAALKVSIQGQSAEKALE